MTLPDRASIASYGGPLKNHAASPIDPTTDRPAAGGNPFFSDVAAMTRTGFRVFAVFGYVFEARRGC